MARVVQVMPNRILTVEELKLLAKPLLESVRARLRKLSGGDPDLHFALRRKLAKELTYDERSGPNERRKLKALKRAQQDDKCAMCTDLLPAKGAILDRIAAMAGYTNENTQLLCPACDAKTQADRGYR